jgi:hypothetical protein
MIKDAVLKAKGQAEFVAGVETNPQHFAVPEFAIAKDRVFQLCQA